MSTSGSSISVYLLFIPLSYFLPPFIPLIVLLCRSPILTLCSSYYLNFPWKATQTQEFHQCLPDLVPNYPCQDSLNINPKNHGSNWLHFTLLSYEYLNPQYVSNWTHYFHFQPVCAPIILCQRTNGPTIYLVFHSRNMSHHQLFPLIFHMLSDTNSYRFSNSYIHSLICPRTPCLSC